MYQPKAPSNLRLSILSPEILRPGAIGVAAEAVLQQERDGLHDSITFDVTAITEIRTNKEIL